MPKSQSRLLLELDSPWFFEPGVIRVFPTEGVTSEELRSQVYRDKASRPYVFENTRERRLHFTQFSTQSVMNMAGELLALAAQTEAAQLDEKLFFESFSAPSPAQAKAAGRRR